MAHDNVLPIEYDNFETMVSPEDTLFIGRYLTNGADKSSVYLDVRLLTCQTTAMQTVN